MQRPTLTRLVSTLICMEAFAVCPPSSAQESSSTSSGGAAKATVEESPWSAAEKQAYSEKQERLRVRVRAMLGIPETGGALEPEARGRFERDGVVVEKWIFTSEPGSRVPCVLYRPTKLAGRMPAVVLTFGHGASKSHWEYQYAGQLYARLGVAVLALDPAGEEERNKEGRRGTRAHDNREADRRAAQAGRLMLGKLLFDTMRGIDLLLTRDDVDPERIGVGGNSLGGTKAQFMAALDTRLRLVLVSGWKYGDYNLVTGKRCTRVPSQQLRELCDWPEFLTLSAPHCAVLVLNGDADTIIERRPPVGDETGKGQAWSGNRAAVAGAKKIYGRLGVDPAWVDEWYEPGGGHRGYFLTKTALEWIHRHLGTPGWTLERIRALPTIDSGAWCDRHGVRLEGLYGTELHQRGLTMPDLEIRPFRDEELGALRPEEKGDPRYTLAGWLDLLEKGPTQ